MKLRFTLLLVLFLCENSFCQKSKISIFKDSKIKIIHFEIDKNPNNLPLLTFTILNKTRENIIFTQILLNLSQFKKYPKSSSSYNDLSSKALTPIIGWDLSLPTEENTYLYSLITPIQIVKKDAVTITIRLHTELGSKHIVPGQLGSFKFSITFVTYDNKGVNSTDVTL